MSPLGMRIVVSNNLPKEHVWSQLHEVRAHPFVAWFLRLLGKSDFVGWGATPVYDRKCLVMGNTIYVSPDQLAELRKATQP